MKCFLHIGTGKTGTTTVQDFFSGNRAELAKAGFCYPRSLGFSNTIWLPASAANGSIRTEMMRELKIRNEDDFEERKKTSLSDFTNEVKKFSPDTKLICSSEQILAWLNSDQELENLKQILHGAGISDITIIVYLRNPSETANSLCSTAIKMGTTKKFEVPPPSYHQFEKICNHKRTVERFNNVFGKEKVVVRLFRKDKFKNNSLIHDISGIVGLDINKYKLTLPKNQNESLSLLGLLLLRNLNEKITSFDFSGKENQREELLDFFTSHFSEPRFVMPKEMFEAYDAYFADSNEWIRQNYFPEEPVLFPYQIPEPSKVEASEDELKSISDFIADIWISRSDIVNDKWYRFGKKSKKKKLVELYKHILEKN